MSPESKRWTGRKLGGQIAEEPFTQALYELAKSRGYVSQMSLASKLGMKGKASVGSWYRGERVPIPESFGVILRLFKPNEKELEALVGPYCQLIAQGRGNPYGTKGKDLSLKFAQNARKEPQTAIGQVIDQICDRHKITLGEFATTLEFSYKYVKELRRQGQTSISSLAQVLEKTAQKFDLTDDELEKLASGASEVIQEKAAKGRRLRATISGKMARTIQTHLNCQTYLPVDIAGELGISRERVRQLREKLGIENMILGEADRRKILEYHHEHQPKAKSNV